MFEGEKKGREKGREEEKEREGNHFTNWKKTKPHRIYGEIQQNKRNRVLFCFVVVVFLSVIFKRESM